MAEVKTLKVELLVEKKQFTNKENGEVIKYNDLSFLFNGAVIKLSVKQDCKQLFEYLLSNLESK